MPQESRTNARDVYGIELHARTMKAAFDGERVLSAPHAPAKLDGQRFEANLFFSDDGLTSRLLSAMALAATGFFGHT